MRRRARQRGFTMVEMLVAMVLFALVATGLSAFAVQSLRSTSDTRASGGAVLLAQAEVESLRGLAYDDIVPRSYPASLGGQDYDVATTVANNTPDAGMKEVTVTVDWTANLGPRDYVLRTILTAVN
jgi:prepilin-type N-terminal cleavage/methylation domain-containing protein